MIILSIRNVEETEFVRNNKYLNINFINQIDQLTNTLWWWRFERREIQQIN